MATLLLRLQGPMQSWGTTSRFNERDTQLEPSKSGVLGLCCAALGRDRSEPVDDLAALRMGVRVDREGVPMRDFHTLIGVVGSSGTIRKDPVVSYRNFLSDAVFLVGLEGERALLERLEGALRAPVWPLFLGRKSFVPSAPVYLPDGLVDLPLVQALKSCPLLVKPRTQRFRLVVESDGEGSIRLDQPVAPFSERRFGPRHVVSFYETTGGEHVSGPPMA